MVGLFLVEGNDEVSQAIYRIFKRLFWFQKLDSRWNSPTKYRRSVFVELIDKQRNTKRSAEFVNRRIAINRHQHVVAVFYLVDNLLFDAGVCHSFILFFFYQSLASLYHK